jgi:hypothetical protein
MGTFRVRKSLIRAKQPQINDLRTLNVPLTLRAAERGMRFRSIEELIPVVVRVSLNQSETAREQRI